MSKELKQIRGQLRQIIKEMIPEILQQEIAKELYKSLSSDLGTKLLLIDTNVKTSLARIDERSKDAVGFLVRQAAMLQPQAPVPTEQSQETKTE